MLVSDAPWPVINETVPKACVSSFFYFRGKVTIEALDSHCGNHVWSQINVLETQANKTNCKTAHIQTGWLESALHGYTLAVKNQRTDQVAEGWPEPVHWPRTAEEGFVSASRRGFPSPRPSTSSREAVQAPALFVIAGSQQLRPRNGDATEGSQLLNQGFSFYDAFLATRRLNHYQTKQMCCGC